VPQSALEITDAAAGHARSLVFPMAIVPNLWGAVLPVMSIIPIGMAAYYLAWKYIVGFLNQEMGIA